MTNLDSRVTAASKAAAYDMARELLQARREDRPVELNEAELQSLLLYFAPAIPAKPKTAADYVRRFAAGRSEKRHYLQWCYSDGEFLVATDGSAMAWTPTDRPAGYYSPKTLDPVDVDATYPQWRRLMQADKSPSVRWQPSDWKQVESRGIFSRVSPWGAAYQSKYLNQCHARLDTLIEPNESGDTDSAMRGDVLLPNGEAASFVVMPIRL